MQTAAWDVIHWPKVALQASRCTEIAQQFRPLGVVGHPADRKRPKHGQAVWGEIDAGRRIGIAWDWAEIAPDVVVLADPMVVVSNLELIDDDGNPMPRASSLLLLNAAIHGLEWQSSALAAGNNGSLN